jgi:hypothetical protein
MRHEATTANAPTGQILQPNREKRSATHHDLSSQSEGSQQARWRFPLFFCALTYIQTPVTWNSLTANSSSNQLRATATKSPSRPPASLPAVNADFFSRTSFSVHERYCCMSTHYSLSALIAVPHRPMSARRLSHQPPPAPVLSLHANPTFSFPVNDG